MPSPNSPPVQPTTGRGYSVAVGWPGAPVHKLVVVGAIAMAAWVRRKRRDPRSTQRPFCTGRPVGPLPARKAGGRACSDRRILLFNDSTLVCVLVSTGGLPGRVADMGLWVRALLVGLCAWLMSACQILAMPGGAEPIYVEAQVVAGKGDDPDEFQLLLARVGTATKGFGT